MEQIGLILLGVSVLGLAVVAYLGYSSKRAGWTGIPQRIVKKPSGNVDVLPVKTLWDWLSLLIVPVILIIVTFWLTSRQQAVQRLTEEERAQNAALQGYLDDMQQLIAEEDLFRPGRTIMVRPPGVGGVAEAIPEARLLARARTLAALEALGPTQKRTLMRFLVESNLIDRGDTEGDVIGHDDPYIDLYNANLAGAELQNMVLYSTYLKGADLRGAVLNSANLAESNLQEAILKEAHLRGVDLTNVELNDADLSGADLSEATLKGVDLTNANLEGAIVTDKQLAESKSLKGVTMPDGSTQESSEE